VLTFAPLKKIIMSNWEAEFEWLRVRNLVQKTFGKEVLPDLNAVLFLIGIQEQGRWKKKYTKEEKQDLLHKAMCKVLSFGGYYELEGIDEEGWPHWKNVKHLPNFDLKTQEDFIKTYIIEYFKKEIGVHI